MHRSAGGPALRRPGGHAPSASKLGDRRSRIARCCTNRSKGALTWRPPPEPLRDAARRLHRGRRPGSPDQAARQLRNRPAQTGQITTQFPENPQLPFEELKLKIFGGARGVFRTPAVCGTYQTTTSLTPFSAPESGPPAQPQRELRNERNGGSRLPAGRRRGAQLRRGLSPAPKPPGRRLLALLAAPGARRRQLRKSELDMTLPPGSSGKLAGIPYCPDAAIAAAAGKSGAEENASPSCPAASEVGTVDVAAGAGPTPINVPGHAYLAGPYKGAPLSLAVVTPAVAGPVRPGHVVVRAALYVNPETTQIHAVSDQFPRSCRDPARLRSLTMKLDRPEFTLNPTNCEEFHFAGSTPRRSAPRPRSPSASRSEAAAPRLQAEASCGSVAVPAAPATRADARY